MMPHIETCDGCHQERLPAETLCAACADERDQLHARLAAVEAERDEAHRRHSEAEGQIACRNELRYRCARAEAELERLRAVADAARQAYRADAVAEWSDALRRLHAALAALDAEER